MGKKGKGNKLAKMSEEERARYLQMRADIEEEARRRKQQLLSLYMKNKLKREDAFCRLNLAKINQEWRSILRQFKCEELREEMQEVRKCFKEALERKQRIIQRLLNDLDIAENMYAAMEQSHMEIIDKIIGIHYQRMEFLRQFYEGEKKLIMQEYDHDSKNFRRMRASAQEKLECVMYQLEDEGTKQIKEQHEKYLECLHDAKSAIQFRLENITRSGEEKLERLWQEYQDVLSTYVKNTETFYSEYMDLKEREEENTTLIKDHYREIEYATEQLANLKLVLADTNERNELQIDYLCNMKNDLYIKLTLKKEQVDREIQTDETRFKLMAVKSHEGLKHFQSIVKRGEVILQLSMICRKYETEREKVMPWSLPPTARRMFEENDDELSYVPSELKDTALQVWNSMEKFWKRVNHATVHVVSLRNEKRRLEDENVRLKTLLQEYLVDFNLSNGSNLHVNDYLTKRPASLRVDRVTQMTPQPTPSSSPALKVKSQSASAANAGSRRRRLMGLGGIIIESNEIQKIKGNNNKNGFNEERRHRFVNITEANLTNAVRSERLVRGKPRLAKIESIVNWNELRRQTMTA